jgi:hypothetical protein
LQTIKTSLVAVALAASASCGGNVVVDPGGRGGAEAATSGTTASASTTATTTTTTGAGGATPAHCGDQGCVGAPTCADAISEGAAVVCGDPSYVIWQAYVECAGQFCAGPCKNLCIFGTSPECTACMSASCPAQAAMCAMN